MRAKPVRVNTDSGARLDLDELTYIWLVNSSAIVNYIPRQYRFSKDVPNSEDVPTSLRPKNVPRTSFGNVFCVYIFILIYTIYTKYFCMSA